MTVTEQTPSISYTADGVEDTYVYNFLIHASTDLKVYEDGVLTALGHTINGVGNPAGGEVIYSSTVPADEVIVTLKREMDYEQETDYTPYDPFPASTHEVALDKLAMQIQQLKEELGRCPKFDLELEITDIGMDTPVALNYLAYDASGVKISPVADGASPLQLIKGFCLPATFSWKDGDEIYISAGAYEVNGKWAEWTSQITLLYGALAADDISYVYVDYSAITNGVECDNNSFYDSVSEPVWSELKRGHYHPTNTDDRCIFGSPTNSTPSIIEFFHSGNRVQIVGEQIEYSAGTPSNVFTTVSLGAVIPKFSRAADLVLKGAYTSGSTYAELEYRVKDQVNVTGTDDHTALAMSDITGSTVFNSITMPISASQQIEVAWNFAVTYTVDVRVDGYYLPNGM